MKYKIERIIKRTFWIVFSLSSIILGIGLAFPEEVAREIYIYSSIIFLPPAFIFLHAVTVEDYFPWLEINPINSYKKFRKKLRKGSKLKITSSENEDRFYLYYFSFPFWVRVDSCDDYNFIEPRGSFRSIYLLQEFVNEEKERALEEKKIKNSKKEKVFSKIKV